MMKKILLFLLLAVFTLGISAQAPSKKCPVCGLSIPKCQYKGKHPKNKPTTPAQQQPSKPAAKLRSTTGKLNGYDWVDLGLSVKWATKNVGASSPSDYGDYFAWGETRPKSSYVDGQTRIATTSGHDTARENWGGTWRMPTKAEFEELCNDNNCKWTWTSQGGHWGYLVTSKINGNSIFLPAAGCRRGTGRYNVGEYGYYRSSTLSLSNSNFARSLNINDLVYCTDESDFRSNGHSVRPVTE